MVERRTRDREVASSNSGESGGRIFFSRVNFVIILSLEHNACPTPLTVQPNCCVTAVARKRPRPFCQKCRWEITPKHAYTLDSSKSEWAVQPECGNLSGNELTLNSSGNARSQSPQLAEPLWTDSGLKSGISVHELIST